MAGLTPSGLVIKRLEEIISDLVNRAKSPQYFGPGIAVDDDTPMGHLVRLFADPIYQLWQLGQQLYDQRDPYGADGVSLDNVGLMVGVEREPARKSSVTLECSGTPATLIPAGSVARVPGGPRFVTIADGTIGGGGTVDIVAEAEEYGPLEADADTITEIVTVVAGWSSVTNPVKASIGRYVETDSEFRIRREGSLQVVGACTDPAIKAHVDALDFVDAATVISNRTLVTDSNGIPGKAFMVVVWPDPVSDPDSLVEAIWEVTPAGILPYGTENYTITDDQGYTQPVAFSYATEIEVFIKVVLTYDSDYGGDDAVKAAVVAYGATLSVGDNVRMLGILKAVTCSPDTSVSGIVSCVILGKAGAPPGPGDTSDVSISVLEIASILLANVDVDSTPATP